MANLFSEAFLRALLAQTPGISGSVIGAGYRLSAMLRETTPLALLVAKNPELALPVYLFEHNYECYFRLRTAWNRARARAGAEMLLEQTSRLLHGEEREPLMRMLFKRREYLTGGQAAFDELGAATRTAAAKRGSEFARRLVQRMPVLEVDTIAEHVERLWLSLPRARRTRGLHLFFETMPLSNTRAWEDIYYRLTRFSKVETKMKELARGKKTFTELFRPEASNLKGLLLENMFWHGPTWARWEKMFLDQAAVRARRLTGVGAPFEVIPVNAPLWSKGQQIWDGAILLARPSRNDPEVLEAVLHVAIQIKSEKEISVVRQITKDIRRETERALFGVRTQARDKQFILVPPPDGREAARIIVTPELPGAARVAQAPLGVDIISAPTLLDALQFDEAAFFLLEATARARTAQALVP